MNSKEIDEEAVEWEEFSSRNRKDLETMERIMDMYEAGGESAGQAIEKYLELMEKLENSN